MIDNLSVRAVLAGLFFAVWPLLINKSGLSGNVSSLVLMFVMLGVIFPVSAGDVRSVVGHDVKLWFAIGAGICSAVGILIFNGILAKASPQAVSQLFTLMLVTQIVALSVYHVVVVGGITLKKGVGYILAVIVTILLA